MDFEIFFQCRLNKYLEITIEIKSISMGQFYSVIV
jgi:hypothetical protein